ncbi:MAG: HAD family hydrolase [Nitratireductor sp.]|nr:HAD family hydrolase [Nitratireductor sp.]
MPDIKTIAFDADDTLWHNERQFQMTQHHFKLLLADHAEPDHLAERIVEAERRNIRHFGYGVKSFTLSLIETAIEVTGGKVPAATIQQIVDAGRDMLAQPVELFAGVHETLEALTGRYHLAVITKGDLFDQERKVAQSGLGDLFDTVEIVSEKTAGTYQRIFGALEGGVDAAMMVGNSLKSDVLPALEAGAWGIYVPHELTWELEHAAEPEGAARYRRIEALSGLMKIL